MNMKVLVAQINPTVGDLSGNLEIIQQSILNAVSSQCDVVVFPELATTGYPPRDLLYSSVFWDNHKRVIENLHAFVKNQSRQITVIVGGLHEEMLSGGRYARYNAAWILDQHFGQRVVHKTLLPCYDVFDETRYFSPKATQDYAPIPIQLESGEFCICDVLICEDIWNNEYRGGEGWMKPSTYTVDPVEAIAKNSKGPLFVLNGSPFWIGKIQETRQLVESIAQRIGHMVVWCNQVGSHDDIITGGYSTVCLPLADDIRTKSAKPFEEDQIIVDPLNMSEEEWILWDKLGVSKCPSMHGKIVEPDDFEMWTCYKALFLHMADYKRRCGFKQAVLGLSGGIDSAVVAVVAAHVFGSENVTGIGMPSPYSSSGSVDDAEELADNLHMRFQIKKITESYEAIKRLFLSGGKQAFDNGVTDENIQPRVRGMILMAHSNEYDPCLLLTTGNKSEITVGYCTIYGDMCGGLAVISDLWKTQVYELAKFMNKYFGNVIPKNTIYKPASAELRPDQKDTDSLPPYEVLDPLLQMFVEQEMTPMAVFNSKWFEEHGGLGEGKIDSGQVNIMYRKYRTSEYKRQQMPPGPKIQVRSFGSGRRMPIAMKLTSP
jgi:NAD+ synthetase